MPLIHSFAPIVNQHARVLILGSMPGAASLRAGEYYAHPRNHFWRLLAEVTGFDASSSYVERTTALATAQIAVWDVLQSCLRQGSLDSSIDKSSQQPNDFQSFFRDYSRIERVYFNGGAAEQIYRRHVLPQLDRPSLSYARLPSSSPANASWSFERKLAAWRDIVR